MSVLQAVERDVEAIGKRDRALADSALAALAFAMAAEIDSPDTSATAKSNCAKVLADTLEQLRALAPAEKEKDKLDDLAARRDARRAGGSAA